MSAALLSGGDPVRPGRDPAGLELGGVAVATRLARLLDGLFEEVLIVGGAPPPDAPGRRIDDAPGPGCPLRGLVGALAATSCERVLVVAADLPCVTPDLLLALVARPEADVVLPSDAHGRHPLCAVYRREAVLGLARERLAAGHLALSDLLATLDTAELTGSDLAAVDPDGTALLNADKPADLARARAVFARR